MLELSHRFLSLSLSGLQSIHLPIYYSFPMQLHIHALLSVYPSSHPLLIHLSTRLSILLSFISYLSFIHYHPSIYSFIHPSILLSTCSSSIHLFIHVSIYLFLYLYIHASFVTYAPFITHPSIHPFFINHSSFVIHPSIFFYPLAFIIHCI